MSTSKIHVFRYQPELSGSIIYWSMTFVLFLLSMIGLLEEQGRINLFSIITFLIFLFFVYLGTRRKMILTNEQLKVSAILKKNRYQIDIDKIKNISVGSHGITIKTEAREYVYVMFPPSKNAFVLNLQKESLFTGTIYGIEKSVDEK
ncbi:EbsA family protein [Vagococcus hydrophili]|uniref:EbsA family protein n=1 Tax=Vagococcus hydrophili TaxID=2714947 RepID=A0A6G8AVA6_9ENTE|nr:EbsA family protein [Vagococcus hydrophili]QIL49021.1 EbsA family protein [Vagococcus hydrophili]